MLDSLRSKLRSLARGSDGERGEDFPERQHRVVLAKPEYRKSFRRSILAGGRGHNGRSAGPVPRLRGGRFGLLRKFGGASFRKTAGPQIMRFEVKKEGLASRGFLITTLPSGFAPTVAPKEVGLAKVYVQGGMYYVQDPEVPAEELSAYSNVLQEGLEWLPPEAFSSEDGLERMLRSRGIDDEAILYFMRRELSGYSVLQPLVDDPNVEDIVVASPDTPISVRHSSGTLETNIILDAPVLDSLVQKLASYAGKPISTYNPLLSARLPDGNRLTLNYGNEVSHRGTSVAIRKFPKEPWSVARLLALGSTTPEALAWLWLLIENRKALIVTGVSGVGKTSMINALTSFIPSSSRIVTVEDAGELRLSHKHWTPLVARYSYTQNRFAEISLDQLVRHALRMSADYIIVGEVRGEEGHSWAQSILTGHGGITSIHSETPELAIQRLISPPVNVEPRSLAALHGIVELRMSSSNGAVTRFVSTILDHSLETDLSSSFSRIYPSVASAPLLPEDYAGYPTAQALVSQGNLSPDELAEEIQIRRRLLDALRSECARDAALLSHEAVSRISWAYQAEPALRDRPERLIDFARTTCPRCFSALPLGGVCARCAEMDTPELAA